MGTVAMRITIDNIDEQQIKPWVDFGWIGTKS
jgi:hypothetical protein